MKTAVVVDDDVDTIDVMIEILEINHIQVIGSGTDGKLAVELYQKLKPDIIFLDVMMPNYDGIYALENIRKIDPNSKVIMITGDVTKLTHDRLEELKPSAVFYKPMDINEVIRTVNALEAAPIEFTK